MRENREDRDFLEIDIWKLLFVFLDRWKLLAGSALAAAVLAFLVTTQLMTPIYKASVTIYVNNINASEKIEYINASNLATAQQLVNTYVNMIRSDTVLEKVIDAADLDDYQAKDIRQMMTASQVDETELFDVYISHPDPVEAARIANAVAEVAPDEIAYFVEGSSTKIIDYAKVPENPSSPSVKGNTVVGFMLGGLLAAAYVALGYMLDVRVKDEEDLAALFDIPMLGQIPNFEEGKNKDARHSYSQDIKGGEQK